MMHKPLLIMILLFQVWASAGCWDIEEVNRRALPNTLFFDQGQQDTVKMGIDLHVPGTLLPPVNTMEQQFEKNHSVLSVEGLGALDAWSKLQTMTSRNVFFGQLRTIIISERFAKQDIQDSLDFIGRMPFVATDTHMLVTKEDPEKLVNLKNKSNFIPGNYIEQYFQSKYKEMLAQPIFMWEVFARLDNQTSDPYFPIISTRKGNYVINGIALFSGPRMVGELDTRETYAFALLNGGKSGYLTVPLGKDKRVSFLQMSSKIKIVPSYNQEGTPEFEIIAEVGGMIAEIKPYQQSLTMEDKNKLEQAAAKYIKQEIKNTLSKLTQLNADPLGFGEKFRGKYPTVLEKNQWHKIYPNSQFTIKCKFNVKKTGLFR